MASDKQKYVVAKGVSFVGNKKHYKEGDPIDEAAFKNPDFFKKLTTGKNPKIIPAPPEKEKDDDEDTSGVDVSGVDVSGVDRPALEKLFIEGGIFDKEKLSKIPDDKLLKLAVKKGLIKK